MDIQIFQNKRGQILIITLIVLVILAIMIVTISNTVLQSTRESTQTRDYSDLYALSEKHILNVSHSLDTGFGSGAGIDTAIIEQILVDVGFSTPASGAPQLCKDVSTANEKIIECAILDATESSEPKNVLLRITESPDLVDVELFKDETIAFSLENAPAGYAPEFEVSWFSDPVALEVILDYKYTDFEGRVQYSSVRGIHDGYAIAGQTPLFPQLNNNLNEEFFDFSLQQEQSFTFNFGDLMSNVIGPDKYTTDHYIADTNSVVPIALRFKPYIKTASPDDIASITLTVKTNPSNINLPQSVRYEATAFDVTERGGTETSFGSQPFVQTSVPYYKPLEIFDYVLRTEDVIEHQN